MAREIAGFPAELVRLPLEEDSPTRRARSLDCWTVARLDEIVDGQALLRAEAALDPPYWALPWIGARAIAATLLDEPPPRVARILEIGCGLGLAGIAAGKSGARVCFSDYIAEALAFARANAEHHRLSHFDTQLVDFSKDRLGERFDWILAADVVYEPASYGPLVSFLDAHAAADARILLTESLRADAKRVLEGLEALGFRKTTTAFWIPEEGKRERTWLHDLRRA